MEQNKTGKTFGVILSGLGIVLLLFACVAWMSTKDTLAGIDIVGVRKLAPTLLGLIFLVAGIGLINRS